VAALSLAAVSQSPLGAARNDAQQGISQVASVEQELKDIDQQWLHAATVQDVDYLKQLFADGMFEVQNGGSIVTGAEMRRYLAIPGRRVQINIDQVEVRGIYGDTAILTDHTTQEGATADGRKITGEYLVMRVLRKQDGKWRAIGANMTPMRTSTAAKTIPDVPGAEQAKSEMSSVEQELVELDHKWVDAATRGDTEFLRGLFGERMFEVQPDGHVDSAAEMLKRIAMRKPGQIEGYCDQIQIRGIYGDTAILTDRRVRKGIAGNGRDVSGKWRVTRVLVKQDGKWRAVAGAMTPIE
jgi:ketosteroid isomerase-like protein